MQTKDEHDPRVRGLTAALSLNRGELDPAQLERLLRLIEPAPATEAKGRLNVRSLLEPVSN